MQTIFEDNFLPSTSSREELDDVSPIKDYLRGKTVFVTGGLGFVGKLLIEKLLRCDVKKIFLLARAKKGKLMEERFDKLTKEAVSKMRTNRNRLNLFSDRFSRNC